MDRIDSQSVVTDRDSQNPLMVLIFGVMIMVVIGSNSVIGPMSMVNIVSIIGTFSFSFLVSSIMVRMINRITISDTFRIRGPGRQQRNGGNRQPQNQQQDQRRDDRQQGQQQPRRDDRQQQQNQRRDDRQQGQSGNQSNRNGQPQTQPQS